MKTQNDIRVVNGRCEIGRYANRPVFYFDLAPVLAQCGRSSLGSPERMQLTCESCVRRQAPRETVLFAGSGFFLVVQSCENPAAVACAEGVNIALLRLLFGSEKLAPPALAQIFRAVEPPGAQGATAATASAAKPSRAASDAAADRVSPWPEISTEQEFRLDLTPIFDLRRNSASTFFCTPVRDCSDVTPSGGAEPQPIASADREWIDLAVLVQALALARRIAEAREVVALAAPVSFETLARPRGRRLYQDILKRMSTAANPHFIVKIDGIPPGTPSMRLADIIGMVRPLVRHVFVELPEGPMRFSGAGVLGASGFSTVLSSASRACEMTLQTRQLVNLAANQRALSCVCGVGDAATLAMVRHAGVRFAGGKALSPAARAETQIRAAWSRDVPGHARCAM